MQGNRQLEALISCLWQDD